MDYCATRQGAGRNRKKVTAELENALLQVKQSAWLATKEDSKDKRTRREKWGRFVNQVESQLPLVGYLWEIQTTSDAPVLWTELQAWAQCSGHEVEAWELRYLRYLSSEYVSAIHQYRDTRCDYPEK